MITDFELKVGEIYLSHGGNRIYYLQEQGRGVAVIREDELEAVLLNLYESHLVKSKDLK